jgi:O-antigen/teichoic acid export membrane protein
MSSLARVARNTAALAVGNLLTKILSLVFLVYVARRLGDLGFGQFSTAMALVGLVSVLPNYLARPYLVREVARARDRAGRLLDQVALSNLILSLLVFAGLWFVGPHFGYDQVTVKAIALLGFALTFDSVTNSYHAALAGFERLDYSAVINVVNTLLTIALGGVILFAHPSLQWLIGAYVAAKALTLVLARRALRLLAVQTAVGFNPRLFWTLHTGAWPFFITTVFVMIYQRLDIVILSFFRRPEEVGYYNAAYKLMEGMGLLAASFVQAVYPVMSRLFVEQPDRLALAYRRSLRVLLAFLIPAAAGLTVAAWDLVPACFGKTFVPAAIALMILVWGQLLDGLNPLLAQALRAADRERTVAWIAGAGAASNVACNLVLIPLFGLYGASVATLISFGLVLWLNQREVARVFGRSDIGGPLARTVLAALIMAATMWLLRHYALLNLSIGYRAGALVLAGCAAYPIAAVICGVLDREDRRLLGEFVRAKFKRQRTAS